MSALQELGTTLEHARARYIQQNPKSKALHAEASNSLPGGNTRAVLHADPFPLYIKSGHGYQVTSEDGTTCVASPTATPSSPAPTTNYRGLVKQGVNIVHCF